MLLKNKITQYLLNFIFLILFARFYGQYTPYFENIEVLEVELRNQNWGITQSSQGNIFVANNNGLLIYDGMSWQLEKLPNQTTVRSVLAHEDKVYTGSYQEFGYWKRNDYGKWAYHSITQKNKNLSFENEAFWQIATYKNYIVFRSFKELYLLKEEKIIPLGAPSTVISISSKKEELLLATLDDGILQFKDDSLQVLVPKHLLDDFKVVEVTKTNYNEYFIATELNGCFFWNGMQLLPYDSKVNSILKEQQLNKVLFRANGDKIFGTIQNGIYLVNNKGKIISQINRSNGLVNNTILSFYEDQNHVLWVGLDKGLAYINLDNHVQLFYDIKGNLGSVHDVISYKGITYIGSNTGLYYLDQKNQLNFIEGTQGQVWELTVVEGDLFCGHNNGTFLIENTKATLISSHTGGWVIKKVPKTNKTYLQGTYTGLVQFKKINEKWNVRHLGAPIIPIRFVEMEDDKHLWAAHGSKGLQRFTLNKTKDSVISRKAYLIKEKKDYKVSIHKVNNQIIFSTLAGWYKYDSIKDSLIPNQYLNKIWTKEAKIISEDNLGLIALNYNNILDFRKEEDIKNSFFATDQYFKQQSVVGFNHLSKFNDSLLAYNLIQGYLLFNKKNLKRLTQPPKPPQVVGVSIREEYQFPDKEKNYTVPYEHNQLRIHLSAPQAQRYSFQYKMKRSSGNNWQPIKGSVLEFIHLKSGKNPIEVRTINFKGETSKSIIINLNVAPPWYAGRYAFVVYLLIALVIIYVLYKLHHRKLAKQQLRITERFKLRQRELLEEQKRLQEKQRIEIKTKSLENEVKRKSKELANNAMKLTKKNEALEELKKELISIRAKDGSKIKEANIKKILKKINDSLRDKGEWQIFENNFNQVHENFFKTLKKNHPKLNARDLKLCAYIRMNLLTKEIAPLMGISIRGVETHRYRLKRKLNLESNTSLVEYLLQF